MPQTFFTVVPEQVSCSRVEHEEMLTALAGRDAERVREVTERHFRNAGSLLSARLEHVLTSTVSA